MLAKHKGVISFEDKYNYKNNSMDIIRLILAVIVLYGHTYPVLYGPTLSSPTGAKDFLAIFSREQIGSGSVAVYMFFIISGFLITQSMMNSKSNKDYIIKRGLRIFPALFFSLVLSVFILGPIVSELDFIEYLRTGDPFKYLFYNVTFGIFGFHYSLADVFSKNPFPSSINASMWTLPYEVACYFFIMFISTYSVLKKRERMKLIYIISLLLVFYNIRFGKAPIIIDDVFWLFGTSRVNSLIELGYYFIAGSMIYCYKDKIKYNKNIFLLFTILLILSARYGYVKYSLLLLLPYVTMYICLLRPFMNIKKYGDWSYGIYIYAFPIQQFLALYFKDKLGFSTFFVLSSIVVLLVSILSWNIIEKPILNLKNKLVKV
ncbi:acyltransferase family protein [Clostridium sp. Marseille-P299]|uniref:acyltransferase family protein n=1 Tax=Clostridium sp. Marseille-P299 TaxID=1805477 RepID=UPI00082A4610|nr:acyltransferase [Clostridium sp. Marseille-P299]